MVDVTHAYKVGLRFEGSTRKDRRSNEILANQQLKNIQMQAIDKIKLTDAVSVSLEMLRSGRKLSGTNGAAKLATEIHKRQADAKARSNLGQHAFLLALNSAKGVIALETKIDKFFDIIREDTHETTSWMIFGRCPYSEYRLSDYYKISREYSRNIIFSARKISDNKMDKLSFGQSLPAVKNWEKMLDKLILTKTNEFASKITDNQKTFLNKLNILKSNIKIVTLLLDSWINEYSSHKRWSILKKLAKNLPDIFGIRKNLRLFSALRSLVVFALSPLVVETVCKLMKTLKSADAVGKPFNKNYKIFKLPPLSLVMGSKYVIQRPGNSDDLTQLSKVDHKFTITFPKVAKRPAIHADVMLHAKLIEFLNNGAKIILLNLTSGNAPSHKIIGTLVFEGHEDIFISTKKVKQLKKDIKPLYSRNKVLGIDINRLGPHIIEYSENVEIPIDILKLCDRYKKLNEVITSFNPSLNYSMNIYDTKKVIKRRGELQRIYKRRTNILKEIHDKCSDYTAGVLVRGKFKALSIEDLNLNTRNTRGALAKAISTLPDEQNLYHKSVKKAAKVLKDKVLLFKVNPRNTSSTHYKCGGKFRRNASNWDFADCKKCNKRVNTHKNASFNIRELGIEKYTVYQNTPVRIARGL